MDTRQKLVMLVLLIVPLIAGGVALAAVKSATSTTVEATGFPVEYRTAKTPPPFSLADQNGEQVTLEALRGKVVVLTAVYATCHTACPTIITQAKAAINRLTEAQRAEVAIVAITLDPEGDTQERRAATTKAHGLDAPLFRYVNGDDPDAVLKLIEDLGWARAVAGDTGVIGHSNTFLLVDRAGRIAYTVTADTENDWLDRGLEVLLAE